MTYFAGKLPKQTKEQNKRPQNFSVIKQQLEEVRNESFKQGVWKGRTQAISKFKEIIERWGYNAAINQYDYSELIKQIDNIK
jgi:hypothetical protein